MSDWKPKRFWTSGAVVEADGGYTVELDGRRVKTPAKAALVLPTRTMAEAIAQEWDAQDKEIDPTMMPFTRSANAAIDKVQHQHGEVADMLADYGDSDLLCYRATHPEALQKRQSDAWDPALDWAAEMLGARLVPFVGVVHQSQATEVLQQLRNRVHGLNAFQLAAFHDLVSLSGSLILGFAAAQEWRNPDEIWRISRLDELWQIEQWGHDDEAHAAAEIKKVAFLHAKRFFDLSI
ncbi:Chaperone required for the assembly of the F1-ATPase [Ruegeria halocynthiae]|uniref:Chaperone required for the assembly of the F1-ATPase n=1 Tax=Ruegeria halocynthiae TaxID=985054 RepID=A0A1H2WJF1_9RHOB|nr:ATP12 family protein [Ruegeria halocynthiae]SDW80760.1 Chaperone required for the assembly of the F1-ATPase [Ruegeria halocynthiae]